MNILLPVPYFSQINNDTEYFGSGYRQCNLTSHAMAVEYLTNGKLSQKAKALGMSEPESYYGSLLDKYGDTTDHSAHTRCLKNEFKLASEWRTDLSKDDIIQQLAKNRPIPIGVKYRQSGHIVLVIGASNDGLSIHDPYGIRYGASDEYLVGAYGGGDFYSWSLLSQVFWDCGVNSGWGRLFA